MILRFLATAAIAGSLSLSAAYLPEPTKSALDPNALAAAAQAQAARDAQLQDSFLQTVDFRLAGLEIALADLAPLQAHERQALQAAPYHQHLHESARIGVPLGRVDRLAKVAEGSPYYVTGWDGFLAPDAIATLDRIGRRFHEACRAQGLPPARFIVTSTYRSADDQAQLRTENVNATHGRSSHEYGGSFDIAYERFLPTLDPSTATGLLQLDADIPPRFLSNWTAAAKTREAAWAREIAEHHPKAYDAVLGRVLMELERENHVLTLREYRQTCYHVTARPARRA